MTTEKLTVEQVKALTDDELNVRLADLLGWKSELRPAGGVNQYYSTTRPDYCNDRNAIAEAENTVPYNLQPVLLRDLKRFVMGYEGGVSDWDVYTATARQRAEALYMTLQ